MNNIELYNSDCLKVMDKLIQDGVKVDAIITDPPYNIARNNNFTTMGRKGIDFGEWDKGFNLTSWISIATKLLNKNGSIIIFNDWKNLGLIAKELENNNIVVKDMLRFIKSNPMPRNRDRRYITDFECAIWGIVKGSKWVFNRQDEKYQRPEYKCSIATKQVHPTQKPIKLMEDMIKIHTNINDTVLDCFMGSGTTGVACKNLNRNFIGIELDKNYFDIAEKRINETEKQERLF